LPLTHELASTNYFPTVGGSDAPPGITGRLCIEMLEKTSP